MSDIILDLDSHVYTRSGTKLPGVSEVLKPLVDFSRVPPALLKFACDRGSAVHRAVELYHAPDGLDISTLDDEVRPRFDAYLKFLEFTRFTPHLSEYIVHHPVLNYAGKLDLFGGFPDGRTALIDIKTGSVEPVAGYQLAAYLGALVCEFPAAVMAQRYALWLGENEYNLVPFTSARDWAMFQSHLIIWKSNNVRVA